MATEKNGKPDNNKYMCKLKNKASNLIDLRSLMTNMAIIRLSVTYLAVKITETADKTGFLRQIFSQKYFSYQD